MRQDDQTKALKLAFVNSVSENAYSNEAAAYELLKLLGEKYPEIVRNYYNLEDVEISLENIAKSRNWLVTGGNPDIERTSIYILRDFRDGKIGKFVLDDLEA